MSNRVHLNDLPTMPVGDIAGLPADLPKRVDWDQIQLAARTVRIGKQPSFRLSLNNEVSQ